MTRYIVQFGKSTAQYNSDTGEYIWIVAHRKPFLTGARADKPRANGYRYISANGKLHSASRTAYALCHGPIPEGMEIDHINRINDDNRPENLRLATREQNLSNRTITRSQSGYHGVSLHKKSGLYRARYKSHCAYFKTPEEASEYFQKIKAEYDKKIFGETVPSGTTSIQEPEDEPFDPSIGDNWDYDPKWFSR